MFDLVCVGDVMLDIHLPLPVAGERRHSEVRAQAGGSSVNAALAAARLGARTAVVGAVGDDPAGRMIADELRRAGIETRLAVLPGRTGTCVYAGGVVADRGANAAFVVPPLPDARATLVSAYLGRAGIVAALEAASGLRGVDLQGIASAVQGADVLIGPNLDPDTADAPVLCATFGSKGASAWRGDERCEAAPARILEEPAVGAGDAFAAGFLLALADGLGLQACVELGCAAATG